jgi:hypothetical protein
MSASNRITVNGVELRYGRTFVGRILPRCSIGAAGRFTSIACVSVDTGSAIVAAIEPNFVSNARRGRRKKVNNNNQQFYSALTRLEQSRRRPGWSPAAAAADIAHLVLLRRDALDTPTPSPPPIVMQQFELWNVEIGELSTASAADINSGW